MIGRVPSLRTIIVCADGRKIHLPDYIKDKVDYVLLSQPMGHVER
jgi:hypothetical protein